MSKTANGTEGRTGGERMTDNTPDISEWTGFSFYDLVWYWNVLHLDTAFPEKKLGRSFGVAHCVGSDLCYWILKSNGKILARTPV